MKRTLIISLFLFFTLSLSSQELLQQKERSYYDILHDVTTNQFGRSNVVIKQPDSLFAAMNYYIETNKERTQPGYRLRIYFDNKQNSRTQSEMIVAEFSELYPNIPIYRTYTYPLFKVTVGDFRTKSEAMKFMGEIKSKYPSVFLVEEEIRPVKVNPSAVNPVVIPDATI